MSPETPPPRDVQRSRPDGPATSWSIEDQRPHARPRPWRWLGDRLGASRHFSRVDGSWVPLLLSLLLIPVMLIGVYARGDAVGPRVTVAAAAGCDVDDLYARLHEELRAEGLHVADRVPRARGGGLILVGDAAVVTAAADRDPLGLPAALEVILVDLDPAGRPRISRATSSPMPPQTLTRVVRAVERAAACQGPSSHRRRSPAGESTGEHWLP